MKTAPKLAARLLSGRAEMSAPEKEAVLDAVLERVAGVNSPSGRPRAWAWAAGGAAVLILLAAVPLGMGWLDRTPRPESGLVARGAGQAPFGVFASCPGQVGCRPGTKLIFRVRAPAGRPWFTAFGQRPDGVVTWYFPSRPQQRAVDTRQAGQAGILPAAPVLAPDHPAGQVRLRGQFCARPLGRAQIRAVYERNVDPEQLECTLVEHSFQVAP